MWPRIAVIRIKDIPILIVGVLGGLGIAKGGTMWGVPALVFLGLAIVGVTALYLLARQFMK
jgi:hypothetical protein